MKTTRYVWRLSSGTFCGTREATDTMYESRVNPRGVSFERARIFQNVQACRNAGARLEAGAPWPVTVEIAACPSS